MAEIAMDLARSTAHTEIIGGFLEEAYMGWGFRKSFKLAPGVKLNLNKRSASLRVGPRNLGITVGSKGVHAGASAPGTGLSVRTKIGGKPQIEPDDVANDGYQPPAPGGLGRLLFRMICETPTPCMPPAAILGVSIVFVVIASLMG